VVGKRFNAIPNQRKRKASFVDPNRARKNKAALTFKLKQSIATHERQHFSYKKLDQIIANKHPFHAHYKLKGDPIKKDAYVEVFKCRDMKTGLVRTVQIIES
jgi:hypothetical protein